MGGCLKKRQLPRVICTFYSQTNPTSSWRPLGNANWGYDNLASMCHQKKISISLLVVIILVHYKWCMSIVQLSDGASGKNTRFPGLPSSLHQKGYPAVKLSASIKSCKISDVMSYNRTISNRDGVIPGRERVKCEPIETVIQRPHQVCKICRLRVSSWNVGTMSGRASEVAETIGRRRINH